MQLEPEGAMSPITVIPETVSYYSTEPTSSTNICLSSTLVNSEYLNGRNQHCTHFLNDSIVLTEQINVNKCLLK